MNQNDNAVETILDYHQRTKHRFERYAAGPATLDWDDQPEAFRWFTGAPQTLLPLAADGIDTSYTDLFTPKKITPQPLSQRSVAALFELSLGLSAWKQAGTARWALRCNPSSGNLHPTEGYLITNTIDEIAAGVHHYLSRDHLLEQRCRFERDVLPAGTLLLGLSSIHWREAWKYGERAFRYCQHDVGHAIGAIRYAAATLGWGVQLLDEWGDDAIATLLGIDRHTDFNSAEAEHPDVLLLITTQGGTTFPDVEQLLSQARTGQWQGQANCLSPKHFERWPVIEEAAALSRKPATATSKQAATLPPPLPSHCELSATTLIRQRRSAQAFDGVTAITAQALYRILDMTLPRSDTAPWDTLPWPPHINLVLFVHRVEGIAPGLYALIRDSQYGDDFKQALQRQEFNWEAMEGCPSHLPLFRLVAANGQRLAATLSCHQAIAAESCFSLGMIARCDEVELEPWRYRQLFWEAGMIGQVLYLEAEAAAIRGTGIGCYFDDPVHELLGIHGDRYQSLYHFTAGGPLIDHRLTTLPPYPRSVAER